MLKDDVVVNPETILLGMTCLTNCRGKESNLPKKKILMHKLVSQNNGFSLGDGVHL